MKIIIAGSRNITKENPDDLKKALQFFSESTLMPFVTEIVCGEAEGVDLLGRYYAEINNIPVKSFPAKWEDLKTKPICISHNKYGKLYNTLAGFNRNNDMAEYADALIAIWDGVSRGTKNMIRTMRKLHKKVEIFYIF